MATTTVAPWGVQQPFLGAGFQQAASNLAGAPFQLPGFGANTQAGIDQTAARAQAGSPLLRTGQHETWSTAQGNYLNNGPANDFYQSLMNGGQVNPALGLAGGMAQQGSANPAIAMLQQTAGGQYLNSNPYVDRMYNQAAGEMGRQFRESVTPGIDSSYARAGRLGSNAFATARNTADRSLGTALGDLATNIYGGNYAQERQNQLSAQNQIGALSNADFTNRLNAISQYGQLGQQGIANRGVGALGLSEGYNAERGRQQAAAQAAPQMAQADYQDPGAMLMVGQLQDELAAKNAALADPNARLAQYMDMVRGNYGQTQDTTTYESNFANMLGGGLGLASLGNQLFNKSTGLFPSAIPAASSWLGDTLGGLFGGGGGLASGTSPSGTLLKGVTGLLGGRV